MISIQTRTGTYRFLRSGGDPTELGARIAEFVLHHQGPGGVSTVTTVATGRRGARSGWSRVRPWLVVLLIAAGSTIGGLLGARLGRRLPPMALRIFVVAIGVIAVFKLIFF